MRKASEKTEAKIEYGVKVTKAKEIKEGVVAFDMNVNGITIYGCFYREYTTKEGKEGEMISFPSYKGSDGKYYSHCWFPISKELREDICQQIGAMI